MSRNNKRKSETSNECEWDKKLRRAGCIKLPTPSFLNTAANLFDEDVTDDPSKHAGRLRSFPHERGNWPTSIYIPYEAHEDFEDLCDLIMENYSDMGNLELGSNFHISLSRTFILKHHLIENFVNDCRKRMMFLKKFVVDFGPLQIYKNDENSRTFVGLNVTIGSDKLKACVDNLNEDLLQYKLPTFYNSPSFHISIASLPGDHKEEMDATLPQLQEKCNELFLGSSDPWHRTVSNLFCKSGNRTFNIELSC